MFILDPNLNNQLQLALVIKELTRDRVLIISSTDENKLAGISQILNLLNMQKIEIKEEIKYDVSKRDGRNVTAKILTIHLHDGR